MMQNALEELRTYLLKQIKVTIESIDQDTNGNNMLKGSLLAFNDMLYQVEKTIKSIKKNETQEHEEVKIGDLEKP